MKKYAKRYPNADSEAYSPDRPRGAVRVKDGAPDDAEVQTHVAY